MEELRAAVVKGDHEERDVMAREKNLVQATTRKSPRPLPLRRTLILVYEGISSGTSLTSLSHFHFDPSTAEWNTFCNLRQVRFVPVCIYITSLTKM